MTDCIFCKIVKGEIPCYKLYEDEDILAFLDITPVNPGHTLIIPKKHSETILDTDDEILKKLIITTKKISNAVYKGLKLEGFNIGINQGRIAGAGVIDHMHIHLVPRWQGDTNFMPVLADTKVVSESLLQTYDKIKEGLNHLDNL